MKEELRIIWAPLQVIILIGNKADLEAQRDVTYEEAKQFAEENGERPPLSSPLAASPPPHPAALGEGRQGGASQSRSPAFYFQLPLLSPPLSPIDAHPSAFFVPQDYYS